MARNIEIKAVLSDFENTAARARALSKQSPERIDQRDTFFTVPQGRLKLRELSTRAELIQYQRPDCTGPKTSSYTIVNIASSESAAIRRALSLSLGIRGEVVKARDLYLHGRTRIHLDRVEGLGDFLELEVVLKDGETEAGGQLEVEALMGELGLCDQDLIEGAYVDLLAARSATEDD